jgi:hypothetical protein
MGRRALAGPEKPASGSRLRLELASDERVALLLDVEEIFPQ